MGKENIKDIYLNRITVPIFKEKVNLIFAKGGPLGAIDGLGMIQEYADGFHGGNIKEAKEGLDGANAEVFRLNDKIIIILPFNVSRGVIAHEVFHLSVMILRKRGIMFCDENEETFAHLIDWLTNEVYRYHRILMKKLGK
jgi:hypothetical protein